MLGLSLEASALHRREPRRRVLALQLQRGCQQDQQVPDIGIGFLGERLADKRQQVLVRAVLQRLRRRHARVAILRCELERSDGRGQFTPQAVVHHYVFAFFRQRRDGLAADGVDAGAILHDQDLLAARDLHCAVVQRLQEVKRGLVVRGQQFGDGGDLVVVFTQRQFFNQRRRDGPSGQLRRE